MNATRTDRLDDLPPRERYLVELARLAVRNTIDGGASALVKAGKDEEAKDIVNSVYSASSGKMAETHDAYECDECGSVHRGREAADECCDDTIGRDEVLDEDEEDDEEEEDDQ